MSENTTVQRHDDDDDVHVDEVAAEGDELLGDVPIREVEGRDNHDEEDAVGQGVPVGEDQVRDNPAADGDGHDLGETIKRVIWTLRYLSKNMK